MYRNKNDSLESSGIVFFASPLCAVILRMINMIVVGLVGSDLAVEQAAVHILQRDSWVTVCCCLLWLLCSVNLLWLNTPTCIYSSAVDYYQPAAIDL